MNTAKIVILILIAVFFGSIIIQFGYNMIFVQPFASETTNKRLLCDREINEKVK